MSPHTVELDFMNQSEKEGTTQSLIKELRTGQDAKVTLKKCVRDLTSLTLIIDPSKESEWAKEVNVDQLVADQDQEGEQVDDQEDDQGQAQEVVQEEAQQEADPAPAFAPAILPTLAPALIVPAILQVPVDHIVLIVPVPVSTVMAGRPTRERVKPRRYR